MAIEAVAKRRFNTATVDDMTAAQVAIELGLSAVRPSLEPKDPISS